MKRSLWLAVFASVAGPLPGQDDSDGKTGSVLYLEGLRLSTEQPIDLARAAARFKKAAEKATPEEKATAAAALVHLAYCHERMEPENIAEAQAAYGAVVSGYGDVEKWAAVAREKIALKGVDVYLTQLHGALRAWRDSAARSASDKDLVEKRNAVSAKILQVGKDGIQGLLWGLGHADGVIRDFAADRLAEVVDEAGIAAVIARLGDPAADMRAGSAAALQKVFKKANEAAELDRVASDLERDISIPTDGGTDKPKALIEKVRALAGEHRKRAAAVRGGIPDKLDTAQIQAALEKIVGDEAAHPQGRLEAAHAAAAIGRISGALADALVKGMDAGDRNVRQACSRAAGAVDTSLSADKHKLADKLIELVQYEPAKDPEKDKARWANDEVVRQAAAEALEHIALVKSLPALIEALDDNDARVRSAADRALFGVTRKDMGYEPDKPLQDRMAAQAKWKEWWENTGGTVVLVERFWAFQSQWKEFPVVKLFDPDLFLREVESRQSTATDPKADMDRARRVAENFQRLKDVFLQDAVDLGPAALDKLLKFVGGEVEREPKGSPGTRLFVAEAAARAIEKHSISDGPGKIRDLVGQGDSPAKKAGAADGLGRLPKSLVGAAERQALQGALSAAEPEVREAAARALGKVGDDSSAGDLTKAAGDGERAVQIAALRSIGLLAPKNAETVKALGEMIGDEPEGGPNTPTKKVLSGPKAELVREHACDALGAIGDAVSMPFLIRARRDTMVNVRIAARNAIQKVHKANAQVCVEETSKVLRDEKRKTDDRIGAAFALGDMGDPSIARILSLRLRDENPPLQLRDQDPGVRIAICRALGALKAKTLSAVERLLGAMMDEDEREPVRDAAYEALKAVTGADLPAGAFKASDPKEKRDAAKNAWGEWWRAEKGNLKDEL